ncbi:hypothetical protein FB451DRAFT_1395728 [Mycena latifolia]|nr:hypothetical protein FB451DRAFT_1395728 [Mycena latifolia]
MRISLAVLLPFALAFPALAAPVLREIKVQDLAARTDETTAALPEVIDGAPEAIDTVEVAPLVPSAIVEAQQFEEDEVEGDDSAIEARKAKVAAKKPVKAKAPAKPKAKPVVKPKPKPLPKKASVKAPAKPAAKPASKAPAPKPGTWTLFVTVSDFGLTSKNTRPAAKKISAKPPTNAPARPAAKPPVKPVVKPAAKPATKPPVKAPVKPAVKPPAKPPAKVSAKPSTKAPTRPVAKPPAKAPTKSATPVKAKKPVTSAKAGKCVPPPTKGRKVGPKRLNTRAGVKHPSARGTISLFHGTTAQNAASLVAQGPLLSLTAAAGDFSHSPEVEGGFYMSDSLATAAQFACHEALNRSPAQVDVIEYTWHGSGSSPKLRNGRRCFVEYNLGNADNVEATNDPFHAQALQIYRSAMISGPMNGPDDQDLTDDFFQYAVVNQGAARNNLALKKRHRNILCKNVPKGNALTAALYSGTQGTSSQFTARLAELQDPTFNPATGLCTIPEEV